MYALTIWQPWATLIMAGAKRYEFRGWDYRTRARTLIGERIAIHAGARPVKRTDIQDLLLRLRDGAKGTALNIEKAMPIVEMALTTPGRFPLAAVLGTAVLEQPRKASVLFAGTINDSDRIDQHVWAWPMREIDAFDIPVPARGAQGFWIWRSETVDG